MPQFSQIRTSELTQCYLKIYVQSNVYQYVIKITFFLCASFVLVCQDVSKNVRGNDMRKKGATLGQVAYPLLGLWGASLFLGVYYVLSTNVSNHKGIQTTIYLL